jgi:hypothetical protein
MKAAKRSTKGLENFSFAFRWGIENYIRAAMMISLRIKG